MLSPGTMCERKDRQRIADNAVLFREAENGLLEPARARENFIETSRVGKFVESRSRESRRLYASGPVRALPLGKARDAALQQFQYYFRPCAMKRLEFTPAHVIVGD
jgi:hypothetical protein